MTRFAFTVTVECETQAQADQVMSERLGYDEQYDDETTGSPFVYQLAWITS